LRRPGADRDERSGDLAQRERVGAGNHRPLMGVDGVKANEFDLTRSTASE
jgi:hypothetical protein